EDLREADKGGERPAERALRKRERDEEDGRIDRHDEKREDERRHPKEADQPVRTAAGDPLDRSRAKRRGTGDRAHAAPPVSPAMATPALPSGAVERKGDSMADVLLRARPPAQAQAARS